MNINDARYMIAIDNALKTDDTAIRPYLTTYCTECDEMPIPPNSPEHGMIDAYVVIGCEGYYQVNPNEIGIESPNWANWLDTLENPEEYTDTI